MDKTTKKIAITTLADTIHMRIVEFTPVDSGYKSLIMSYTDQMLKALEDLVAEFGDEDDQATYERVMNMVVSAEKSASVRVVSLA